MLRGEWRTRAESSHRQTRRQADEVDAPKTPTANHTPTDAPPINLSSKTLDTLEPWLVKLRDELRRLATEAAESTESPDLFVPSDADTDDDDDATGGLPRSPAEAMSAVQHLGAQVASLTKLVHGEILTRLPSDPEALFLAASAHYIARDIEAALRLMRESVMAEQRVGKAELGRRHYFLAACALRLVSEGALRLPDGGGAPKLAPVGDDKRRELLPLAERHLLEAARLGARDFASPYIDLDLVAKLTHPSDLAAHAAHARRLAEKAASAGAYWRCAMQRPPHFHRSLRSRPFHDASEFVWATTLLRAFDEMRSEALALSKSPVGAEPSAWDSVGSKHDAGDANLSDGGDWTEVVLLHSDEALAAQISRNRRRCPASAAALAAIAPATDMAKRGIGECTLSSLGAGAHLLPHCGSTNARLTCHLPLVVPDGCEIRVGDETRQYREGELLFFDDSYEHEVWNRHPTDRRIVLLLRFWHPDIPADKYGEMKRHMKRTIVRHRRALAVPPL